MIKSDSLKEKILQIILSSSEPLETKEIEGKLKEKITSETITRTKVFYRLNILRGDGVIKGKFVGSGKGVWIWWRVNSFKK